MASLISSLLSYAVMKTVLQEVSLRVVWKQEHGQAGTHFMVMLRKSSEISLEA